MGVAAERDGARQLHHHLGVTPAGHGSLEILDAPPERRPGRVAEAPVVRQKAREHHVEILPPGFLARTRRRQLRQTPQQEGALRRSPEPPPLAS
ncbi:MAG TPA: hypothetical protein VF789_20600 [Thermoanaerobaculia bacterium]